MRDTVELLEAIGRDAALRRASPEELARVLEAAGASTGLRELVADGDDTALTRELGLVQMHVEHQSQTGGHEGDGPGHGHDHDHDHDHDKGKDKDHDKDHGHGKHRDHRKDDEPKAPSDDTPPV